MALGVCDTCQLGVLSAVLCTCCNDLIHLRAGGRPGLTSLLAGLGFSREVSSYQCGDVRMSIVDERHSCDCLLSTGAGAMLVS